MEEEEEEEKKTQRKKTEEEMKDQRKVSQTNEERDDRRKENNWSSSVLKMDLSQHAINRLINRCDWNSGHHRACSLAICPPLQAWWPHWSADWSPLSGPVCWSADRWIYDWSVRLVAQFNHCDQINGHEAKMRETNTSFSSTNSTLLITDQPKNTTDQKSADTQHVTDQRSVTEAINDSHAQYIVSGYFHST